MVDGLEENLKRRTIKEDHVAKYYRKIWLDQSSPQNKTWDKWMLL